MHTQKTLLRRKLGAAFAASALAVAGLTALSGMAVAETATGGASIHKENIFWWTPPGSGTDDFKSSLLAAGKTHTSITPSKVGDSTLEVTCTISNLDPVGLITKAPGNTSANNTPNDKGGWRGESHPLLYNSGVDNVSQNLLANGLTFAHKTSGTPASSGIYNRLAASGVKNEVGQAETPWMDQIERFGGSVNRETGEITSHPSEWPQDTSFDLSCSATLDGVPVPLDGLVIANAESNGQQAPTVEEGEYQKYTPIGEGADTATWHVLDIWAGCDDRASDVYDVAADNSLTNHPILGPRGGDNGASDAMPECGVPSNKPNDPNKSFSSSALLSGATGVHVQMHENSGSSGAIAVGVYLSSDFGDAPQSYGAAGNYWSGTWDNALAKGTSTVLKDMESKESQGGVYYTGSKTAPDYYLGATRDTENPSDITLDKYAKGDDSHNDDGSGGDEDGFAPGPDADLTDDLSTSGGTTTYSTDVQCTANGGTGYVGGWIDWNLDGVFNTDGEQATAQCTGGTATLTWNVPAGEVVPWPASPDYGNPGDPWSYLRLRISSNPDDIKPNGIGNGEGEVEDYRVTWNTPVNLTKTSYTDPAGVDKIAGTTYGWVVTLTNTGNLDYTDAYPMEMWDDLEDAYNHMDEITLVSVEGGGSASIDPDTKQLTWTGPLAAGKSIKVKYQGVITKYDDGRLQNAASSAYDPDHSETVTDSLAKLDIAKDSSATTVNADGTVTYTITVKNNGKSRTPIRSGSLVDDLSDVLDDGEVIPSSITATIGTAKLEGNYIKWSLGGGAVLNAGQTATITYTVKLNKRDGNGQAVNKVTLDNAYSDQEDTSTTTTDINYPPEIKLTKTADQTELAEAKAGDKVTYTFTVENIGRVEVQNVKVNDPLVGGDVTVAKTTLAPGESTTGTAEYTLTQADIDAGEVLNTATATGEDEDGETAEDTDDETVTITSKPAIELVKSADQKVIENGKPGDKVVYTFTVTNTGNTTLTDVKVNDPKLGGAVTIEKTTLAPGESTTGTAEYTLSQADVDAGKVDNVASTEGTDPKGEKVTDEDDETVTITQNPAIELVKSADQKVIENGKPGDKVVYTFTVTNTGNVTLSDVKVNDPKLGGAVTIEKTTLAPGESTTGTAEYTLSQADVDAGKVDNVASTEGTDPKGEKVTDEDDETVTITQNPAIDLVKSADQKVIENGKPGDKVVYTFTVTNTGNVTLSDVKVNDPKLGGAVTIEKTTLAPGESTTGTAEYTLTQADVDAGKVDNTASTEGTDPNGEKVTDEDDETVTITQKPAIEVVKTADVKDISDAKAGDTVKYSFTVVNTGNVTLTNVVLEDVLPGVKVGELSKTTLAAGENATASGTYVLTQADVDAGKVDNTVKVTGEDPNGEEVTDEDDETVTTTSNPAIDLVKSVDRTLIENGKAGDTVTYTFVITNTGAYTLHDVTLNDPKLGGSIAIEKTTLVPGESTTGTAEYTLTQADVDAGKVDNVASTEGTDPKGEKVTDEDDVTVTITSKPAIELVKSADQKVIENGKPGDKVVYTFTVTNTGNTTLTDVKVDDPKLGGAVTIEKTTLAPGESTTGTAEYTLSQADVDAGKVDNTASTEGTDPNGEKVTDEDDETVTITQKPAIDLVKSADQKVIENGKPGDKVTYTFTVTNTGNTTLTDVKVDDPKLGGAVTIEKTTLAPGESTTGTAEYTLTQADVDAGKVDNVASTEGTDPKGEKVTDEDDETVTITQKPAIDLVKSADQKVIENGKPGDKVVYTFTVTNTGNTTLTDVKVDDPKLGGAITIEKTTLAPGESTTGTAEYTLTQADVDAGKVDNTASTEGTDPKGEKVTDEDDVTVTITSNPAIDLVKSADQKVIENGKPGDKVVYTFTVTNTGNTTLTDVKVDDPKLGGSIAIEKTTLAPGESTTGTAEYTLTQADVDAGKVDNVASTEGTDPKGEKVTDEDDVTVTITSNPAIDLVKSADQKVIENGKPGDKVVYTFTVTNTGNTTLTDVKVDDPKLGGAITIEKTTLAPGESTTGTAEYTLTQADVDAGKVDNVASTEGTDPNGEKVTDEDDVTVTITSNPEPSEEPSEEPTEEPTPAKTYWVTYVDEDGNTIYLEKTTQGVGEDEPEAPKDPSKDGYKFTGWTRTVDDEGNVTYTAHWEPVEEPTEEPTQPSPSAVTSPIVNQPVATSSSAKGLAKTGSPVLGFGIGFLMLLMTGAGLLAVRRRES